MVPLSSLVKIREIGEPPRELNHFNQRRSVTHHRQPRAGLRAGRGAGLHGTVGGQGAQAGLRHRAQRREPGVPRLQRRAGGGRSCWRSLFIFLVLSAQFESFIDPFVIMLSVPLSMVGALGAMHLTGGTLNVFSQIGLVTLVGLITKHGILIVEFANQKRQEGLDVRQATLEGASLRLRPILMTTGAMVLGALPLALGTGAGAESRAQIGWVIVGGMSVGTVLHHLRRAHRVHALRAQPCARRGGGAAGRAGTRGRRGDPRSGGAGPAQRG
jgi:multidrug efflux pump